MHPTDRTAGQASDRATDTDRLDRTITGIVELGDQRGRTIGFPTANIRLGLRHVDVADGVYASIAQLADGRRFAAATSVGRRPTFYLEGERLCEVHLIDFAEDIYSTRIRVQLIDFLRGQQRFESIDDLEMQLRDDVEVSARACAHQFAIECTSPVRSRIAFAPVGILSGKVVVVTGGARGIGRAHCRELGRHGATVVVNDVAPERRSVVEEIRSQGGEATDDDTSVTDFGAVGAMLARVIEQYGRLDAIVNNAAIIRNSMIARSTEQDWDDVLAVNLKGTFALLHHASAYWRDRSKAGFGMGGRVVNTVSGAGLFGSVGQASYGASKGAIANLTATAALELARYNVTVNAISPSARTEMTKGLAGLPAVPDPNTWDPLDPANSSPVVAWLVSERSHWLTGAILRVRGNTVVQIRPWAIEPHSAYTAQASGPLTIEELDDALRQHFVTTSADPPPGW